MKHCVECGTENADTAAVCTACGASLATSAAPGLASIETVTYEFATPNPEDRDKDLVTLLTCPTLPEADLVVSHLEAAGIPASTPDEYKMLAAPWDLIGVERFRVQIPPEHFEAAKEILLTKAEPTMSNPSGTEPATPTV